LRAASSFAVFAALEKLLHPKSLNGLSKSQNASLVIFLLHVLYHAINPIGILSDMKEQLVQTILAYIRQITSHTFPDLEEFPSVRELGPMDIFMKYWAVYCDGDDTLWLQKG
jgi:hypothetical protein